MKRTRVELCPVFEEENRRSSSPMVLSEAIDPESKRLSTLEPEPL